MLPSYEQLADAVAAAGAAALQIDEPVLVRDLDEAARAGLVRACSALRSSVPDIELTVASYFADLGKTAVASDLPVDSSTST